MNQHPSKKTAVKTFLWLIWLALMSSSTALGAEPDRGEALYMQYCSSCHGKDGRGNGSVTPYRNLKVPDLSLLKKNHNGIYPLDDVMAAIDGRRSVRAHGDRQMPVWGEVFRNEVGKGKYSELTSLLKAKTIAEYVARLQR